MAQDDPPTGRAPLPVGAWLLPALLGVFVPVEILTANRAEFNFPTAALVPLLAGAAGLAALALLSLRRALPPRATAPFDALLLALALGAWLAASLLPATPGRFGVLDGRLDLSRPEPGSAWEWVAFGLGLLALVALARRFAAALRSFALALGVLLALLTAGRVAYDLLAGAAADGGVISPRRHRSGAEAWPAFGDVSTDRAAFVLVLDTFQSDFLDTILARRRDLAQALDGFTFYRDAASAASLTDLALPALHARRFYTPGADLRTLYRESVRKGSVLTRLAQDGWKVDLVNPVVECPEGLASCDGQQAVAYGNGRAAASEAAFLLDLALFRVLPRDGRRFFYNDGLWRLRATLAPADATVGARLLERLGARLHGVARPTLHFVHLFGSHPPALVRADCTPEARPWTRASAVDQAECVLAGVASFLDRLRGAGLYDSSLVLVLGDHGAGLGSGRVAGANEYDPFAHLVGRANPLLLLKPRGAHGALSTSDAPVQLADVPGTLCALEPGCGGAFGPGLLEVPPDAPRERRFQYYQWGWRPGRPVAYQEFSIVGPLAERGAWSRSPQAPADLPTRLDFAPSDGDSPYGLGWGFFETSAADSVRWAQGREAELFVQLPVGRPAQLVLRVGSLPSTPAQRLALAVNGTLVGEQPVVGWLHELTFELPAGVARPGPNALRLRFAEARAPGSGDPRELAVIFDRLEVR